MPFEFGPLARERATLDVTAQRLNAIIPNATKVWEGCPAMGREISLNTCPYCAAQINDDADVCPICGKGLRGTFNRANAISHAPPLTGDPSKGTGLLFGLLLIQAIYGIAASIYMLWTGTRASAIELIIFALLAADAFVLLMALRRRKNEGRPGLLGYLSVWILGLIPYFGWVIVYGAGKGIAESIERRRGNAPAIALFVFVGVIILCLSVYLLVSDSPLPKPET
jgi:hypothetical protein